MPTYYDKQWAAVVRLYRAAGILALVDPDIAPHGYVYGYGVAALGGDPPDRYDLGLHDLAHYLVAPAERRKLPNFGLGNHPSVMESRLLARVVTRSQADLEEESASLLNVLMARDLFGVSVSRRTMDVLGFPMDLAGDPENRRAICFLEQVGLLAPNELRLTLPTNILSELQNQRQLLP